MIAMVVGFISISTVLIDVGFSRVLIQHKQVSDVDSLVLGNGKATYAIMPLDLSEFSERVPLSIFLHFRVICH